LTPKSPPTVPTAGFSPIGIAVSPGGESVYVANSGSRTVSQYDLGNGGTLTPKSPAAVAAGFLPTLVAVTPDGANVYVTNQLDDTVSQYDVGGDGRLAAKTPPTIATGRVPYGIAVGAGPGTVPTSKDQCKNGGWGAFPAFANQGQCVAFVEQGL
jgi:YVTN family beta-propeller protein